MKYLVAVSGGIDSVVLLHMLVHDNEHDIVVAHFDHGIRDDSSDDARFVEGLAHCYGLPFVTKSEVLGKDASEELARKRRYAFLRGEAKKYEATIATAHHADDVIETVAINLTRGTGWRGLAVLDTPEIARPLLHLTKQDIRKYALANRLEWVEDGTNAGDQYLRNRLRGKVAARLSDGQRRELLSLWEKQRKYKQAIDNELGVLLDSDKEYSRHFFIQIDMSVAVELLRYLIGSRSGGTPTRPQAERAVIAIKTARPGSIFQIGSLVALHFTERTFTVETP